jgi:hypothetical protein
MRQLICVGILLIVNGCSSQPAVAPAANSAIPIAENTPSEPGSSLEPALARAAKGYRVVHKNGRELYCRDETPVGSHMSKSVCLTQDQLRSTVMAEQEAREAMRAPRTNTCSGGPNCRN